MKERREEIHKILEDNKEDIKAGKLVVYMIDESHLLSGDVIGYGWGKTRERIEVPIKNEKERQTFYGALNLYTGEFHIQKYDKGETSNSIAFLEYLQSLNPDARILIFWDGASYHRSTELKKFLSDINKGKKKHEWKITCEFFAPHDPSQNPVEDIWLQAKNALRKYWQVCRNFAISKYLFEFFIHKQIFSFPKLEEYRSVFT